MAIAINRNWLITAIVVGAIVVAFLAFGVFGVHTLFIDEEVSEAAPVFTATESADVDETTGDEAVEPEGSEEADDEPTDEAAPAEEAAVEPITVASGTFVDGDHPTSGMAVVLSDGGSQTVLRLEEDFATDNGPDLNVYLASSADDFGDEYLDLGDLKGNIGSQNYEVPVGTDLELYDTVVIWCVRFGVGFGSAELA